MSMTQQENARLRSLPSRGAWIEILTRLNYEVVGQAVAAVRCSAPLDEHWKDAIEEDFRKRQKRR